MRIWQSHEHNTGDMSAQTHLSSRDTGQWSVQLELSEGASTSGMYRSLWNTFMIKVTDLFAVMEILECGRTSSSSSKSLVGFLKDDQSNTGLNDDDLTAIGTPK